MSAVRGLSLVVFVLVGAALSGCAPRGETRSLQQVLETARYQFAKLVREEQSEPLKGTLLGVAKDLEAMVSANGVGAQVTQSSNAVATTLNALIQTAGYTSRASMREILMQHRVLSNDASKAEVNPARVKLLVARTYSVISSEVATTKFAVLPLKPGAQG